MAQAIPYGKVSGAGHPFAGKSEARRQTNEKHRNNEARYQIRDTNDEQVFCISFLKNCAFFVSRSSIKYTTTSLSVQQGKEQKSFL